MVIINDLEASVWFAEDFSCVVRMIDHCFPYIKHSDSCHITMFTNQSCE